MEPHDELRLISDGGDIITEESLRDLSKSLRNLFPKNSTAIKPASLSYFRSLHSNLLHTAKSAKISIPHTTAALDCLSGFCELCCASLVPGLRALPFSYESWTEAFEILLVRSDDGKAKPLKRLLSTLTRLIQNNPHDEVKSMLIRHAIHRTAATICKRAELTSVKAACQVLESFLNKRIVDAFEIVLIDNPQDSNNLLRRSPPKRGNLENFNSKVRDFILHILDWIVYPDCAPAAGRLLATFSSSVHQLAKTYEAECGILNATLPCWVLPVKESLERHPNLLDVYENHILPDLLRLSVADTDAFLGTLPFSDIQDGTIEEHNAIDIHLCFLIAKLSSSSTIKTFPEQSQPDVTTKRDHQDFKSSLLQPRILDQTDKGSNIDVLALGISLIDHSVTSVRIAALSLIISHPSPTHRFSERVLSCLRYCLPLFHVEANTKSRNEFIALSKKLCLRLRSVILSLNRKLIGSDHNQNSQGSDLPQRKGQENLHVTVTEHLAFHFWYADFLSQQLRPTASYQSHITALKVLHQICLGEDSIQSNLSKFNRSPIIRPTISLTSLRQPLLDLLLDPFDDVRDAVNRLLELPLLGSRHCKDTDLQEHHGTILKTLETAEVKAAETGRADHADGVGRLYDLLYTSSRRQASTSHEWHVGSSQVLNFLLSKIEEEVALAQKYLLQAVNIAPLHSHLIALKYITRRPDYRVSFVDALSEAKRREWIDVNERLLDICNKVWVAVRDVLCLDAPEGTDVSDEEVEGMNIGTKDILSYCWRALKESSSLMHAMVTNREYTLSEDVGEHNAQRIGALSLNQLGELRHRGAFSTVSTTFASCCIACRYSHVPSNADKPKQWYQEALMCIAQNASSLTRRSAGLPAMITGILGAYPSGRFFSDVILDLQAIADAPLNDSDGSEDTQLPQIHALNCLKDIFTDVRFAESSETHLPDTLAIAASSLESNLWAMRNCGLMLFKALLRRLNGGTDAFSIKVPSSRRRSSHLAYQMYPTLQELVPKLLDNESFSTSVCAYPENPDSVPSLAKNTQKAFAAFEVVERSGLPPLYSIQVRDVIRSYAQSPEWLVREKAAKTLSAVISDEDMERECTKLLSPEWASHNELHGRLLCLKSILGQTLTPQIGATLAMYERLNKDVRASLDTIVLLNACPITAAAFVDCMTELSRILVISRSSSVVSLFSLKRLIFTQLENHQRQRLDADVLIRAMTRFTLLSTCLDRIQTQQRQKDQLGLSKLLPACDVDLINIFNQIIQFPSDENILAALKITSRDEIRLISSSLLDENRSGLACPEDPFLGIRLVHRESNPLVADLRLAQLGYSLGIAYVQNCQHTSQERLLAEWIHLIQAAGAENAELRRRAAAAFSLQDFFHALTDSDCPSFFAPDLLILYLALYDILVDDDEDVRERGASTVSLLPFEKENNERKSQSSKQSLSAPAAKRRLLDFLKANYRGSRPLLHGGIERLSGLQLPSRTIIDPEEGKDADKVELPSVAKILIAAQKPQVAVFIEEKQNLYIDIVEEAEAWADVLTGLDRTAWDAEKAAVLQRWTTDGLSYVIDHIGSRKDEPLASTSNPEIYALYMRVLFLAKVLVVQSAPEPGEGQCSGIESLLQKLLELSKSNVLNGLLRQGLESVLGTPPPAVEE